MPELPEVETVVRGLKQEVKGLTIVKVAHVARHLLSRDPRLRSLAGERFVDFRRRGKYIIATLSSGRELMLHLRMSGRILFGPAQRKRDKHDHLILEFAGSGHCLVFNDTRKFGVIEFLTEGRQAGFHALGLEATAVTGKALFPLLQGSKRPIKALLLDQTVLAGVGNIYADEALYRSKIHPLRSTAKITRPEATKLAGAVRTILHQAIKKMGTTFDSYSGVNGNPGEFARYLRVYNREDTPCRRCGGEIKKIRAAGRGTHYCPTCQT